MKMILDLFAVPTITTLKLDDEVKSVSYTKTETSGGQRVKVKATATVSSSKDYRVNTIYFISEDTSMRIGGQRTDDPNVNVLSYTYELPNEDMYCVIGTTPDRKYMVMENAEININDKKVKLIRNVKLIRTKNGSEYTTDGSEWIYPSTSETDYIYKIPAEIIDQLISQGIIKKV